MEENSKKKIPFGNLLTKYRSGIMECVLTVVTLLLCLFMLEYASVTSQIGMRAHLSTFSPRYILLNLLTLGVVWSVLLILCNRVWLANLLCSIIFGGIAIVNYYVILFHGMPLSFQVLRNFTTAMNVISNYHLSIDRCVAVLVVTLLFSAALSILGRRFAPSAKLPVRKRLIRDGILLAVSVAVMYFGYFSENPVKPPKTMAWSWTESYDNYGFAACTVESFCQWQQVINKPEGYSEDALDAVEIGEHSGEETAKPDIILILNETFYDLAQITDPETDVDYLPNIRSMDNLLSGYAVIPGEGGSTHSAEYELLTSNSLQLMPGITPFNTFDLHGANSIVAHLNALGYSTTGSHSEVPGNYSRGIGYSALAFQNAHFEDDFTQTEYYYDRQFNTDESVYRNLMRWYEEDPEDQPRFQYLLTIQNHGSWDRNDSQYDTVHALKDFGEYDEQVDEFLTCISQSDAAFQKLTEYFAQVDRPVIICMMGDHAPRFASSIIDEKYSGAERALLVRKVPLLIWANYELEQQDLGTMSMNYVVPTLLELAGVELSPYYSYMLQLKEQVPILSSYGSYYDAEGNLYGYDSDEGGIYEEAVDNNFYLEYNNLQSQRKQELFEPYQ